MIRYAYVSQFQPPAPFIHVSLRNPASGFELRDQPAQLDTAADRTVLPATLVKSLNLPQVGVIAVAGFGGVTYSLPIFPVVLGIHDFPPRPFQVTSHAQETWILLGRDVLNGYNLVLDGPQLAVEIQ